jgi:hypothetical protein
MNNEHQSGQFSREPNGSSLLIAELKAQSQRLQEVVQKLEDEQRRDSEALAAVQAELNEYRRLLYNWAHQQVREEDWKDFADHDYNIRAEDAIAELERQEGV